MDACMHAWMDVCLLTCTHTHTYLTYLIIHINLGSPGSHLDASVPGPRGAWPGALLAPGEKDTGAQHGELGSSAAGLATSARFYVVSRCGFQDPKIIQKLSSLRETNGFWGGKTPTLQKFRLGKEIYCSRRFHDVSSP